MMRTWLWWTFVAVVSQNANGLVINRDGTNEATSEAADYMPWPMMYYPHMYYPRPPQPDGIMRQQNFGGPVETSEGGEFPDPAAMPPPYGAVQPAGPGMQPFSSPSRFDSDLSEAQKLSANPISVLPPSSPWWNFNGPTPPPLTQPAPITPRWAQSYSPPVLFKNMFPGPEYMSFYMTRENMGQPICDQLIQKQSNKPALCASDSNDVLKAVKDRPLQCLNDKLWGPGGIYSRACAMCAVKELDGIVWTATSRNNRPCHGRYAALNRLSSYINNFDSEVIHQIHSAMRFYKKSIKKYKTLEASLEAEGKDLTEDKRGDVFIDTNSDGKTSVAELKAFLQAVFMIEDVIPEIGYGLDDEVGKLSVEDKTAWMEFAPSFRPSFNSSAKLYAKSYY